LGGGILKANTKEHEMTKHASLAAAALLIVATAAGSQEAPKLPPGYLQRDALPDSLALLPPPPASGSAAFARDEEVSRQTARAPDSPRWKLAASDADLHFPHALSAFACPLGVAPDPNKTPALYRLLGRMAVDVGLSTYKAKNHYQRTRPFVAHNNATCLPADEPLLRKDGSYPSGHSALGWGWALVLAELAPARADAILQRGRDFGQSRLVCNAHWASDVDAGRLMASATVARLHADAGFDADLAAARKEVSMIPLSTPASCATVDN
jgi:acid phosphatase (class A)